MEPVDREEWLRANHDFDKRMTRHEDRLENFARSILEGVQMQGKEVRDVVERLNNERARAMAEEAAAKLAKADAESKQREAQAAISIAPRGGGGMGTWIAWFVAAALTGKEVIPMLQQLASGR